MKKLLNLLVLGFFTHGFTLEVLESDIALTEDSDAMLGAYDRRVQRFEEMAERANELQSQIDDMALGHDRRAELQERLSLALSNSREVQDSLDQMENYLSESLDLDDLDFDTESEEQPQILPVESSYPQVAELARQRTEFDRSLENITSAVDDMKIDHMLGDNSSNHSDFDDQEIPLIKSYGKASSYQSFSVNNNGKTAAWEQQTTAEKPVEQNAWNYQTYETAQTPNGEIYNQSQAGQTQDLSNLL